LARDAGAVTVRWAAVASIALALAAARGGEGSIGILPGHSR
jgi:hypothetical protein